MIRFIIHDKDGNIIRSGMCQQETLEYQANDGEHVMTVDGDIDQECHKVIDGKIIKIEKEPEPIDIRPMRNALLRESDWSQMPDAAVTEEQREQYKRYRQALRDLPQKYANINDIKEIIFPELGDF